MSGTANNSTNASDVGLIVQGTLIFLSAVVGVLGYVIQSRLSQKEAARQLLIQQKEHGRQLKLKRVRQQIEIFVGPALAYIDAYGRLFARSIMHYFNPGFNFNQLSEEIMGFPMTNWGTMDVCYGQGWMLTKENEKIVLNDLEGEMAKRYRDITRVIIYKYLEPLSKLIMEHGNAQQFRPSMADFKKQFPGLANANRPRHLVLYDMKIWTDEFLYSKFIYISHLLHLINNFFLSIVLYIYSIVQIYMADSKLSHIHTNNHNNNFTNHTIYLYSYRKSLG